MLYIYIYIYIYIQHIYIYIYIVYHIRRPTPRPAWPTPYHIRIHLLFVCYMLHILPMTTNLLHKTPLLKYRSVINKQLVCPRRAWPTPSDSIQYHMSM